MHKTDGVLSHPLLSHIQFSGHCGRVFSFLGSILQHLSPSVLMALDVATQQSTAPAALVPALQCIRSACALKHVLFPHDKFMVDACADEVSCGHD